MLRQLGVLDISTVKTAVLELNGPHLCESSTVQSAMLDLDPIFAITTVKLAVLELDGLDLILIITTVNHSSWTGPHFLPYIRNAVGSVWTRPHPRHHDSPVTQ